MILFPKSLFQKLLGGIQGLRYFNTISDDFDTDHPWALSCETALQKILRNESTYR